MTVPNRRPRALARAAALPAIDLRWTALAALAGALAAALLR